MIHGHVEIALNLWRVQIQCECPAGTGRFQQVRHEFRGDRNPGLVFAVLPRIAVIRQHRRNTPCRRALKRVDHQQQLQQVAVHGGMARLHDEYVCAAHILQNLEINLTVAESPQQRFAQRHVQVAADTLRQYRIRGPGENLESVVVHDARAPCGHSAATPPCRPPYRKDLSNEMDTKRR